MRSGRVWRAGKRSARMESVDDEESNTGVDGNSGGRVELGCGCQRAIASGAFDAVAVTVLMKPLVETSQTIHV